jgi:hypothetical protein
MALSPNQSIRELKQKRQTVGSAHLKI